MSSTTQWLFLQDVAALISFAVKKDFKLTGGELYRHKVMQEYYLEKGTSTVKQGFHQARQAIDFNIFIRDLSPSINEWFLLEKKEDVMHAKALGDYWESLSIFNEWGGYWKVPVDGPHFQRRRRPRKVRL